MRVHIVHLSSYVTKVLPESSLNVGNLFDEIFLKDVKSSFFVLCNGRKVDEDFDLEDGKTYHIIPRFPGGKGGFGSMLRAIGAQIEKTTSREACRDLSGRRMRDINNEKKLKEWLAKEAERESEREQRRQERLNKQLEQPQHKFNDAEYHEQRIKMQEDLQDAVSKGLKRTHKKGKTHVTEKKMKAQSSGISKTEWIGVDIESDESNSSSDNEANPGDPYLQASDGSSCSKDHTLSPANNSSSSDIFKDKTARHPHSCQDVEVSNHSSSFNCGSTEDRQVIEQTPDKITNVNTTEISEDNKQPHNHGNKVSDSASSTEPVDLDIFSNSTDLAKLGMERLKNALMARGLKCGGTLEERADRLFSVKGLSSDEIDPSLYAKLKGKGKKSK